MINERLSELITNPESINGSDIPFLEGLVMKYPYFQPAHFLLLISLKRGNSDNFNQQLRNSAVHIPDRQKLYNMLYGEKVVSAKITIKEEAQESNTFEEPIEFQFENTKPEYTIDEIIENRSTEKSEILPELLEIEDNISKPIDDVTENSTNENEKEPDSMGKGFSLIDKFIDENPVFTPNKLILDHPREDISVSSVEEDNSLVTETLASVFEMQKLYEKAIGIYEKLILKFPEKSTYFASRINELKEKIK